MSRPNAIEPNDARRRTSRLFATTAISTAVAMLLAPLSAAAADKSPRACNTESSRDAPKGCARLQQFGLVHVGAGQGLRVNIVFADPMEPGMPASCDVAATLIAADGSVLVQEQGRLAPGQSHVLDFDAGTRTGTAAVGSMLALRASISAGGPPEPIRPDRIVPCTVLSTLEVYDGATGQTRVLSLPAQERFSDPMPPTMPAPG